MPIEKPHIPNFELCRCIGRGNYGDVWLAKSISGTWCAIKIVWSKNFPDNESFEQEFTGVLYYEPISRTHEGLMKILYVGRDEVNNFYYYVNELADDSHKNHSDKLIPESYHPATLNEVIRRNPEGLKINKLLEISRQVLSAVAYLHSKDLIHRDIKPSNIIFIDGKAKLADIGSVSLIGEKSLVGTQGYMPPEGPIAKQSDLYSIGKVMYEAFTGLDRLEFPKIPQQKQLFIDSRKLNKIICKLANPQLKQRYTTAQASIKDIDKVIQGKNIKSSWDKIQLALLFMAFLLSTSILAISWGYFNTKEEDAKIEEIEATQGWFKVSSQPQGAQVINLKTKAVLGITPLNLILPFSPSQEIELEFTLKDYQNSIIKLKPKAQKLTIVNPILRKKIQVTPYEKHSLSKNTTPINFTKDASWKNSLKLDLIKFNEIYVSKTEISNEIFNQYLGSIGKNNEKVLGLGYYPVVNITREEAKYFCEWLTQEEEKLGIIAQTQYYRLPSDREWSALMGHNEDANLSPFEREKKAFLKNKRFFNFNPKYKLKNKIANLADESYYAQNNDSPYINDYNDGWAQKSSVGFLQADANNLNDIIGNVWEWINDDYSPTENYPFCRGGSWKTYDPLKLSYAYRNVTEKSFKSSEIGFRVVLVQDEPKIP